MALLTDKVVLVSGGTQGVGAGVARAAAAEGAAVAVTGRRRQLTPASELRPSRGCRSDESQHHSTTWWGDGTNR